MTKRVDPTSMQAAVRTVAGLIGWDALGAAVGRTARGVRYWGDPDKDRTPSLSDAARIDAAYIAAGGLFAPLRDAYCRHVDRALSPGVLADDPDTIVAELTCAARESGQANAAGIQLVAGNRSKAVIHATLIEVSEAADAFQAAERRLSVMLGEGVA